MGKNPKITTIGKLSKIIPALQRKGKVVVSTNGFFDVLHVGHIRNLKQAKSLGDVLIVGVNTDKTIKEQKGTERPIFPLKNRLEMLAAFEAIDYVFPFSTPKPSPWIKRLKPDIHTKGGDYTRRISDQDAVESYGGTMVFTKVHNERTGEKYATTSIIERIKKL